MPFMLTDKIKALNRLWNAVAFDLRQAFGMAHFHICHLFHLFQQPLKISFRNGKPQCWLYFIRSQFAYIQDSKRFFRFKREKNWKRENWFQQRTKTEICASNKWKSQPFKSHKDHSAIMMRFFVRIPSLHHFPLILAEMNMNHRGEKTETQENSFACLMFMFDSDWSIKIFRPLGKIIHWIVRKTSNYSNVDGKRDQKWFMQTTQSHDWCMNLLGLGTSIETDWFIRAIEWQKIAVYSFP